jgi:hypothetical protein
MGAWFEIGDQPTGGHEPLDPANCLYLDWFRVLDFAGDYDEIPGIYTVEFDVWCCDEQGCPVGPSLWNSGPFEMPNYGWNYVIVDPPVCLGQCCTDPPRVLITATHTGSNGNYPAWGTDNIATPIDLGCEPLFDYGGLPVLWPRPTYSYYSTIHSGYYGQNFSNCPPDWFVDGWGEYYGYCELPWTIHVLCQGPCGVCTGTISGTVTADSAPMGGVTVNLYDSGGLVSTVTTDAVDGSFDFGEVYIGDYVVEVVPPAGYGPAPGCNLSVPLTLDPGEALVVNFQLEPLTGTISGTVTVDSSPLGGVTVDLYEYRGDLLQSVTTDITDGTYDFGEIDSGDYVVELILPLGYGAAPGCNLSVLVGLAPGEDVTVDFQLVPIVVSAEARSKGYWKHQYKVHDSGRGHAHESIADLDSYHIAIFDHFYDREDEYAIDIDGVTNYLGGKTLTRDNALNTLSARGSSGMDQIANAQFLALLLNVVSNKIGQYHEVTADGMTVSQAITFVADLLEDADASNDELAKDVAEQVNENHQIAAGTIPSSTPHVLYGQDRKPSQEIVLDARPNPAAEAVEISYSVPSAGSRVILEVYELSGRMVRTLVDSPQPAGPQRVIWHGDDARGRRVAPGVYFYRLEMNGETHTLKTVMLR